MSLFYIEYGCSICTEHLIVLANSLEAANEFAYAEAQNVYYSYDCNYPDEEECEGMTEDEIAEMSHEDMEQDIQYLAVVYDPNNEDHMTTMRDQDNKPHEIIGNW